jgi:hypothetical protein
MRDAVRAFGVGVVAAVLAAACGRPAATPPVAGPGAGWSVRPLSSPGASNSGEVNLASGADGRVYLSWIETAPGGQSSLRFASRGRGEGWTAPAEAAHGYGFFVNWADVPSLLPRPDGALVTHWLEKGTGQGYDVRVSVSQDGGREWSPAQTPHRDGTASEHGFAVMAAGGSGETHIVWLDGRDTLDSATGNVAMRLMHAALDGKGRFGPETTLDPRVCDCCQVSAAMTSRGLLVVYRDRSATERRDVSAVRLEGDRWSEPVPVAEDDWEMNGCPINGPALAADGARVAVAWFTAAHDVPRVKVALSQDGGLTFGPPESVDDGRPVGRVDVALLPGGGTLVSWVEQAGDGAELRVRELGPGPRPPSLVVAGAARTRSSGFPRLEAAGGEPVLAWREAGEDGGLATVALVRE